MGYFENLKQLLYPLRVYELESGAGAAELFAEGRRLDEVFDALEELERESIASTAEGYGLEAYEAIMPFVPVFLSAQQRREAIMALMRIDPGSFTLEAMNRTIAGCGVSALVSEGDESETVNVTLLGVRGIPEDFDAISWRIEQILPCHLGIEYVFSFLIWQELEAMIAVWQEIEDASLSWSGLEAYTE